MGIAYRCCGTGFFIHIGIIVFLVGFAGLMSGLTLGLMSMSLVDLEVLAKSGTPSDRKHAGKNVNYVLLLLLRFFSYRLLEIDLVDGEFS